MALRRRLGATAWFVLEELVIGAEVVETGGLRTRASTRELALRLELNKDTVTRALAKLRGCGVITVARRGGATGASVFAISVPAGVVVVDRTADVDVVARRGNRRRGTGEQSGSGAQLSLLT
jgi:DNA-binding transcriptional ArsR family regulator